MMLTVFIVGGADAALAQVGAGGPGPRPGSRQAASVALAASSSAEDSSGQAPGADAQFGGFQIASSVQGNLSYTPVQTKRLSIGFTASSGLQHYARLGRVLATGQTARANASFAFGARTLVGLAGSINYSPDYSIGAVFAPSGDDPAANVSPAASGYSVTRNPSTTLDGGITLAHRLGARAAIEMGYAAQQTAFSRATTPGMKTWGARGRFTYQLRRDLGLRLGYGRRSATYTVAGARSSVAVDDIDAGVDFTRSLTLSLAKNTKLSFATGSAITSDARARSLSLTGTVNLDRTFGRTAQARLAFDRGVRMIGGFTAPVFVDTITSIFTWAPNRRIGFSTSASFAAGDEGTGAGANGFQAWQGSAALTVRSGRVGSFYGSYSYTERGMSDDSANLQGGLPSQRRHALRVGVATSIPLLRRPVREP